MINQEFIPDPENRTVIFPGGMSTELQFFQRSDLGARLGSLSTLPFFLKESSSRALGPDRDLALAKIVEAGLYDILTANGAWDTYSLVAVGRDAVIGVTNDVAGEEEVLSGAIHEMLGGNYVLFASPAATDEVVLEGL